MTDADNAQEQYDKGYSAGLQYNKGYLDGLVKARREIFEIVASVKQGDYPITLALKALDVVITQTEVAQRIKTGIAVESADLAMQVQELEAKLSSLGIEKTGSVEVSSE